MQIASNIQGSYKDTYTFTRTSEGYLVGEGDKILGKMGELENIFQFYNFAIDSEIDKDKLINSICLIFNNAQEMEKHDSPLLVNKQIFEKISHQHLCQLNSSLGIRDKAAEMIKLRGALDANSVGSENDKKLIIEQAQSLIFEDAWSNIEGYQKKIELIGLALNDGDGDIVNDHICCELRFQIHKLIKMSKSNITTSDAHRPLDLPQNVFEAYHLSYSSPVAGKMKMLNQILKISNIAHILIELSKNSSLRENTHFLISIYNRLNRSKKLNKLEKDLLPFLYRDQKKVFACGAKDATSSLSVLPKDVVDLILQTVSTVTTERAKLPCSLNDTPKTS